MRKLICFVILALPLWAAHPQFLIDSTQLAALRAKATSNTADWVALKAACDANLGKAVRFPNPVGDTSGTMVPGSGADNSSPIIPDYAGGWFEKSVRQLATCYQVLHPTDPATAHTYFEKAKFIRLAMDDPPVWVTVRGNVYAAVPSNGAKNWGTTGNVMKLWTQYADVIVGDTMVVTGARGCTSINGTWTVAAYSQSVGYITAAEAPTYNADCVNYNLNIQNDDCFAERFYPKSMSILYDWFYDEWTADERTAMIAVLNRWLDEDIRHWNLAISNHQHPDSNYFAGELNAFVSTYLSTTDENSRSSEWLGVINARVFGVNKLRDYRNCWNVAGGSGEAWNAYGSNALYALMQSQYAFFLRGVDWRTSGLDPIGDAVEAYLRSITPNGIAFPDFQYVTRGYDEPEFFYLGNLVFARYVAERLSHPKSSKLANLYDSAKTGLLAWATSGKTPIWDDPYTGSKPEVAMDFLYYNPDASTSAYTTGPLASRLFGGTGTLGGNYAVARSSWDSDATYVTFWSGPMIGQGANGKTQFDGGSITVQRGDTHILVHGLGESARNYSVIGSGCHSSLHNERLNYTNSKESVFFADRPGGLKVQGYGATRDPGHFADVTTHPTKIDRAEESVSAYAYYRAVSLEKSYIASTVDSKVHVNKWTRQVMFLRPKVIVVHDITNTYYADDYRQMMWQFGKTPTEVTPPATGLHRLDIADGGVFKGALTTVLPVNHLAAIAQKIGSNYDSLCNTTNLPLYQVQVRPNAFDHTADNYLAVIDTSATPELVAAVTPSTTSNIDAAQVAGLGVVAFAKAETPVLPMTYTYTGTPHHYIAGLAPNASYGVTIAGGTVTIDTTGSATLTATNAGILEFDNSGVTPLSISLNLSPPILSFSCQAGSGATASQSVSLSSTGGALDNFTVTKNAAWLTISPTSGSAATSLTATADCTGLTAGNYTDTVSVASTTTGVVNSPQTIGIALAALPPQPAARISGFNLSGARLQ